MVRKGILGILSELGIRFIFTMRLIEKIVGGL